MYKYIMTDCSPHQVWKQQIKYIVWHVPTLKGYMTVIIDKPDRYNIVWVIYYVIINNKAI